MTIKDETDRIEGIFRVCEECQQLVGVLNITPFKVLMAIDLFQVNMKTAIFWRAHSTPSI